MFPRESGVAAGGRVLEKRIILVEVLWALFPRLVIEKNIFSFLSHLGVIGEYFFLLEGR